MNTLKTIMLFFGCLALTSGAVSTAIKLTEGLCGAIRRLPQKRKWFIGEIISMATGLYCIIYLIILSL